jgi:hypothetical protein
MDQLEPRRLHPLLLIGMLSVPIVFVWLFLRKGYSRQLRTAAFVYTFTPILLGITAVAIMVATGQRIPSN